MAACERSMLACRTAARGPSGSMASAAFAERSEFFAFVLTASMIATRSGTWSTDA